MFGCYDMDDAHDKWKHDQNEEPEFEMEDEEETHLCDWCHKEYEINKSKAREPERYCSPSCRSLHYAWSE